jgi:hypothetical protein
MRDHFSPFTAAILHSSGASGFKPSIIIDLTWRVCKAIDDRGNELMVVEKLA